MPDIRFTLHDHQMSRHHVSYFCFRFPELKRLNPSGHVSSGRRQDCDPVHVQLHRVNAEVSQTLKENQMSPSSRVLLWRCADQTDHLHQREIILPSSSTGRELASCHYNNDDALQRWRQDTLLYTNTLLHRVFGSPVTSPSGLNCLVSYRRVVEDMQHRLLLLRLPGQQVKEAPTSSSGHALTQDQRHQGLHHGPHWGRLTSRNHQLLLQPAPVQTQTQSGQRACRRTDFIFSPLIWWSLWFLAQGILGNLDSQFEEI